ncbi:MAG TPA: hypothetical protein VH255_08790 [Verrucomicrobiae bacterium]|jgi:hypothetical protein|nr:hypothetical protein [Verrucomicrobiae bacterium]
MRRPAGVGLAAGSQKPEGTKVFALVSKSLFGNKMKYRQNKPAKPKKSASGSKGGKTGGVNPLQPPGLLPNVQPRVSLSDSKQFRGSSIGGKRRYRG